MNSLCVCVYDLVNLNAYPFKLYKSTEYWYFMQTLYYSETLKNREWFQLTRINPFAQNETIDYNY